MKEKRTLLKFGVAIAICLAVHILVALFSSLIVNNYILNTRLANFTIYEGYADFSIVLFYFLISALLIFNKIKGNGLLIAIAAFLGFIVSKVFVIDVIQHYIRFYVKTQQNGVYSFEIFKDQLARNWRNLLWEFSNFGQLLSSIVWVFIALLSVCYLSLWVKNKLKPNIKINPIFGLFLLFGFSSCGDNIQRKKDKYPDIPEFPSFKQNGLTYKKLGVATVSYKAHQSAIVNGHNLVIHTQDYFFYAVADSSLFIVTGYREAVEPGKEFPAKNFITLTRVRSRKIEKLVWVDTCDYNLPIFKDGKTLIVGNRLFNTQCQFLTFTTINKDDDDLINKSLKAYTWYFTDLPLNDNYKALYDSTFVKELDRVTIGSDGKLSGGLNNGIDYTYSAVPLIYYKFNVGNKIGITKINFDEQKPPLLLKTKDNIYCITYSNELKLRQKVQHYEIGVIE